MRVSRFETKLPGSQSRVAAELPRNNAHAQPEAGPDHELCDEAVNLIKPRPIRLMLIWFAADLICLVLIRNDQN
jgi:hypothetical protein